jgi:PAS domain S-box-containing protein
MKTRPVNQRLVELYLMYGLAGLFCFLVPALVLAWRGELTNLAPLTIIAPLIILLVGSLGLRQAINVYSEVERQLCQIADSPSTTEIALRPIVDGNTLAAGWNRVSEHIASHHAMTDLEGRLTQSLDGLNQRRLEEALSSLSDGVAMTDSEGTITFANRSFDAILASSEGDGDLVGRRLADVLASAVPREVSRIQERLGQPISAMVFELRRGEDAADGALRIERSPLMSQGEQTTASVWTVRDVTQQRLAEATRNQFALTASHELRTPLTNIKAYAETLSLEDDIDVEQQKEFCNIIHAEATRLARFVDDMIDVSQMESGALSLARSETDVARLLEEVIEHVQPELRRKRIDFTASLPPKLPKLNVDKDKIAASLVNLLGNAAKYTAEGGQVGIQVQIADRSLLIHVEDGGIGIAEEELPKVFDKFFRSSDARVQAITGSGLGLAFTHEVVRMHGGQLTVHSEFDKGSKFTVQLPIG